MAGAREEEGPEEAAASFAQLGRRSDTSTEGELGEHPTGRIVRHEKDFDAVLESDDGAADSSNVLGYTGDALFDMDLVLEKPGSPLLAGTGGP